MKNTTHEDLETSIGANDYVCISFDRTTVSGRENYGADADGNRGIMIDTIDVDEWSNVRASFDNNFSYIPFENLALDTREAVEAALSDYFETHEPTVPDEPERDWDRDADDKDWWD